MLGETKQDYRTDRAWADSFEGQVSSILSRNAMHLVSIRVADRDADNKRATDFVVEVAGGTVAVRLRRDDVKYRDLTIRAKRDSGFATELSKIKAGWASHYLYGWTADGVVSEWLLVDMGAVRTAGLLDGRSLIPNGDGTYFIAISVKELDDAGCILNRRIRGE